MFKKRKNVSQEKLAQYLNVSFQAVSKWENSNTYPDISLLPNIARFFGITVDELLQAEKIDEKKLYSEYEEKAADLYRNGHIAETIPVWLEAYRKMPNNVDVKEMLMSAYFDTDKTKYQNEIIELGTEIYNSNCGVFYKGQAIKEIARTYSANNNDEMAKKWAQKSYQLMHSQEMIYMQILREGEDLVEQFSFANYWYFKELFYMAAHLSDCDSIPGGKAYTQTVDKVVAQIYELIYPNDDMSFEDLLLMCEQHRSIAEDEIALGNDENVVRHHLTRAFECAKKSISVKEHGLTHPLVMGFHISAAPSDNKKVTRLLRKELDWPCFDEYKKAAWFDNIVQQLDNLL